MLSAHREAGKSTSEYAVAAGGSLRAQPARATAERAPPRTCMRGMPQPPMPGAPGGAGAGWRVASAAEQALAAPVATATASKARQRWPLRAPSPAPAAPPHAPLTRLNHVLSRLQSDPEGLTRYVQALEARAAGPEANLAAQFAAVLARLRAAACAAA